MNPGPRRQALGKVIIQPTIKAAISVGWRLCVRVPSPESDPSTRLARGPQGLDVSKRRIRVLEDTLLVLEPGNRTTRRISDGGHPETHEWWRCPQLRDNCGGCRAHSYNIHG